MELLWGMIEVGLTIGADLLPRAGGTCPHCGRALPAAAAAPSAGAKAPDDELAGSDPGAWMRHPVADVLLGVAFLVLLTVAILPLHDFLLLALLAVIVVPILAGIILFHHERSVRRPDCAAPAACPPCGASRPAD